MEAPAHAVMAQHDCVSLGIEPLLNHRRPLLLPASQVMLKVRHEAMTCEHAVWIWAVLLNARSPGSATIAGCKRRRCDKSAEAAALLSMQRLA